MSRFQYYTGKVILIFGSIVIGIPMGILAGLIYFFRVALSYPFSMYRIANNQWLKKQEVEQEDIWTRHIRKMEEEKERVRKNSN